MASPQLSVTLQLRENSTLPTQTVGPLYPARFLTLRAPDWSVKIGRSTSTGSGPRQAPDNAWYSSRVISRDHAEIKADPETRELLIRDSGSMHGTHIAGRRLKSGVTERLYEGDNILFGAEVARGDETFLPIDVTVSYDWSDGYLGPKNVYAPTRNYFTADYSEDEPDSYDSEGSMDSVMEVARQGAVLNNFSVPESDISDEIGSVISDEDPVSDEESPTSSPIDSLDHANKSPRVNGSRRLVQGHRLSPPPEDRLSPSLGDQQEGDYDDYSGEDSYYDDSSIFDGEEEVVYAVPGMDQAAFPEGHLSSPVEIPEPGSDSSQPIVLSPSPSLERPAVREPSPSDAAMVKPPPQTLSGPFNPPMSPAEPRTVLSNMPPYLPEPSQSQPGRSASAWAGHNSVLYDAMPQPFDYMPYFPDPPPQASGPADFGWCGYRPDTVDLTHLDPLRYHYSHGLNSTTSPVLPARDVAPGPSQKRKADQISEDNVLVPDTNKDVPAQDVAMSTVDPAELHPIVVTETTESIKSPQPARKKVKKNKHDTGARKHSRGSTFAKYAATAVVSAAAGAVGALGILVALPEKYFAGGA